MKLAIMMLTIAMLAAAALVCRADQACVGMAVEASVEAGPGELTLADLLTRETCLQVRERAARVSLGKAPRPGSVRVLEGREVQRRLEILAGVPGGAMGSVGQSGGLAIPPRIVVRRRGPTKSCAEIARFVGEAATVPDLANVPNSWPSSWRKDLDCAAARGIPEEARLELTKSSWSQALERWEFALRCARPGDCIPFLVWAPRPGVAGSQAGASGSANASAESFSHLRSVAGGGERLVAPGQTATLTWDQAGIRVVLPVTCLDAGALGQFVRVRLKNAPRVLRAEVVGVGTLRASL